MLKKKITTLGNSAAVVLPKDILRLLDLQAGDEIEMKVEDNSIILRPVDESIREKAVAAAFDITFKKRAKLLQNLAKGVDAE